MTQPAASTVNTAAGTTPAPAEQLTDAEIAEGAAVEANQLVLELLQAHRADTTRAANLDIDILARRFVDARPWAFDTTATDTLVVHAATLREAAEATGDAERLGGYTPQVASAAADQIEQIALRAGALGGFTVRSAGEIRADAGAPGKHASDTGRDDAAAAQHGPAENTAAEQDDSVADAELNDAVIEHALVGTLVHVPGTLDDIAKFLHPEDISHQRVRVAYTVLQQLREDGALVEAGTLDTDRERLTAAHTNHQTLLRALRASALPQAGALVAELTTAASTNSLLDRADRVPEIQLRMARTVLANSARRAITHAGVRMRRASLLTLVPRLDPARVTHAATEIRNSVDQLAQRLATAGGLSHHGDGDKLRQLLTAPARTVSGVAGLLVRRAERDLIHLALRGNTEVLMYSPQDFARREHANTWRAIQNIHARGEPINYVSVFSEQRALPAQHRPALSAHQLQRQENRDLITPSEIRRAYAVVARSAIRRDARQLHEVTRDLAGRTDLPVDTLVAAAQLGHDTTTRFARTTLDRAQRRPGRT